MSASEPLGGSPDTQSLITVGDRKSAFASSAAPCASPPLAATLPPFLPFLYLLVFLFLFNKTMDEEYTPERCTLFMATSRSKLGPLPTKGSAPTLQALSSSLHCSTRLQHRFRLTHRVPQVMIPFSAIGSIDLFLHVHLLLSANFLCIFGGRMSHYA